MLVCWFVKRLLNILYTGTSYNLHQTFHFSLFFFNWWSIEYARFNNQAGLQKWKKLKKVVKEKKQVNVGDGCYHMLIMQFSWRFFNYFLFVS